MLQELLGQRLNDLFRLILSDRFRTMINVLGDAFAAGIMAHLCKKDFERAPTPAASTAAASNGGGPQRVGRMTFICSGQSAHAFEDLGDWKSLWMSLILQLLGHVLKFRPGSITGGNSTQMRDFSVHWVKKMLSWRRAKEAEKHKQNTVYVYNWTTTDSKQAASSNSPTVSA